MSPITLTGWDQLAIGGIWLMTMLISYLRGSTREMGKHIATLHRHVAFLRSLPFDFSEVIDEEPEEDDAQPPVEAAFPAKSKEDARLAS